MVAISENNNTRAAISSGGEAREEKDTRGASERKESERPRIRHRNAANHYRHLILAPPLDPAAMLSARGERHERREVRGE